MQREDRILPHQQGRFENGIARPRSPGQDESREIIAAEK